MESIRREGTIHLILTVIGPFRGQKRDLYEGGIRTPFVIQWPGVIPQGVVTNHISAFWDFLPTIGELVQAIFLKY